MVLTLRCAGRASGVGVFFEDAAKIRSDALFVLRFDVLGLGFRVATIEPHRSLALFLLARFFNELFGRHDPNRIHSLRIEHKPIVLARLMGQSRK